MSELTKLIIIVVIFLIPAFGIWLDYRQKAEVTKVCLEIDWKSPTCEKLKQERLSR